MLDVYSLVSVLPRLPLTIESLATFEDNIFVGTREGHLLMYKTEFRGTFNKDGIEEAEISLVKSSKNFSKKPISQLAVISEFHLLVCLSDNIVSIHDMGSTESGSFPVLDTISKTKGATLFTLYTIRDPNAKFSTKVTMCVVVRQRLLVYFLKSYEKRFEEVQTGARLSVPDTPKCVVWVNDVLYVNVAGEYQRMKLNGDYDKLFPIDKNQEPKILPLPDGRIAFGYDNRVVFASPDGNISRETLTWSGVPNQIAQDAPFLFALFPSYVEIRSYDPPGKGEEAMQRIEIPKAKWACESHTKGITYIASPTAIWALKGATSLQLIDRLLSAKQFELAENIAKYSTTNDSIKQEWFQRIRNIFAFQLFCDNEFRKSFDLYFQLGTEPPFVIGLLPDFLPTLRETMVYPSKLPELTGSSLEKATFALIEYLTEWRQKLILESNRRSDGRTEEEIAKSDALMQIVDTSLLKCYLATNRALVSNLLRLNDNHCNFEESERCLKKAERLDELIILYKNKKCHKKALEFLKGQMDMPKSPLNGHLKMARYLVEIAKDELDLVFQYARYVIRASAEDGLMIFTDDNYECEQIPREKVFDYLHRTAPELLVPYLEHIINVWNDETDAFHTALAEAYIKRAATLIKENADSPTITELRKKLQTFLASSEYYTPAVLLAHVPLNCMFEERALILGRMGRFEQALGLYVHVLKDDDKAEKFCEQFYDPKNLDASQVYYLLFKTYVKPPEPSTLGVLLNDPPSTERKLDEAFRILRRHSSRIDYAKGMELVPKTVSVAELADFLVTALQVLTSKRRQVELMKNLHYAEYLQMQYRRIMWESEMFTLTEDDTCEICRKRIGRNTAFIRSPNKKLRHYACGNIPKR